MSIDKKPQVFISYAHDDLETVGRLYADLKERSVNVWFDKVNLKPGMRWKTEIRRSIPRSRYFLFCLSKAALRKTGDDRSFIDEELQLAYDIAMELDVKSFTIIPVRLEECGRGESDARIKTFQQFDLFEGWEQKVDELAVYLGGEAITSVVKKEILSQDQELLRGNLGKAMAHFYAEAYEAALPFLDSVILLDSQRHDALVLKGVVLQKLGHFNEGIKAYQGALRIYEDLSRRDPRNPYVRTKKELALFMLDRFDEALQLEPDNVEILAGKGYAMKLLGREAEARAVIAEIEESQPVNEHAWIMKGMFLNEMGRAKEAIEAYDEALKLNPDSISTLMMKGGVLYKLGRYKELMVIAEKAKHLKPDDPEVHLMKVGPLLIVGRHDEALMALDEALRLEPNNSTIWLMKGSVLHLLNRMDESLVALEKAKSIGLDNSDKTNHYSKWINSLFEDGEVST